MVKPSLHMAILVTTLLLGIVPVSTPAVLAKEFDVTGTLDCGIRSGRKCSFSDWATGPKIGVLTRDLSGNLERVVLDASWIRDDLTDFGQDDFVWFVVRDDAGPDLRAIAVIEHRCSDGRFAQGQVNQGRSNGERCFPEMEHRKKDKDD